MGKYRFTHSINKLVVMFFVVILILAGISLPPFAATAHAESSVKSSGDYQYYVNDDGTSVTINGYTGKGGAVTIPSKLGGLLVIGISGFAKCKGLTSVVIPDSVTAINGYAFAQCEHLTSVTIPGSVSGIGGYAFSGCTALTSINLPGSVIAFGGMGGGSNYDYIYDYTVFLDCSELTQIIVDDKNPLCSSLDGVLFNKDQSALWMYPIGKTGSYMIPGSVTSIGCGAFTDCANLTGVTIPGSVTSIDGLAFAGCTSLNSLNIPDSVTSIGDSAFSRCTGLNSITIPDSITSIGEGVFSLCTGLSNITIPGSVTSIGVKAFSQCEGLNNISIPPNVTSIGSSAFTYCSKLKSVYFYGEAPDLGDGAFSNCASDLTIYYRADKTGFINPWQGYATATFVPTAEELANADTAEAKQHAKTDIAAALALLPTDFTAEEGRDKNLLGSLNVITGMSDTGTILTLVSSNTNVTDNGAITYTKSPVTGEVEVHINKAGGTEKVITITVTVPATEVGSLPIILIIAGIVLVLIIILRIVFRKKRGEKAPTTAPRADTLKQENPQNLFSSQRGTRVIPNTRSCPKCGIINSIENSYCQGCGGKLIIGQGYDDRIQELKEYEKLRKKSPIPGGDTTKSPMRKSRAPKILLTILIIFAGLFFINEYTDIIPMDYITSIFNNGNTQPVAGPVAGLYTCHFEAKDLGGGVEQLEQIWSYDFHSDGTYTSYVNGSQQYSGTWSQSGNILTINIPDIPNCSSAYSVQANVNSDGNSFTYGDDIYVKSNGN